MQQKVEYIKAHQQVLRKITKEGFLSLNLYAFFLILKKHSDTGLIYNFSTAFTRTMITEYGFSRNTIKERVRKLQEKGCVQYNNKKNILHITTSNKLKSDYEIDISNCKNIKIKIENRNHKAITAQLRAVASDLYLVNKVKSYKIQQRKKLNGLAKSANKGLNLNVPEFITNISRKELANVIGSKYSATGFKMMKRLKHFKMVKTDVQQADYIKDCDYLEYLHCYVLADIKNHYYLKFGKLYQQLSNKVQFVDYSLKITDIIF